MSYDLSRKLPLDSEFFDWDQLLQDHQDMFTHTDGENVLPADQSDEMESK